MSRHLYNEMNPYRAAVLRERIADGFLPEGDVDERKIEEIPDEDFQKYTQIHLFAGIGGFPLGMRRAGFPENIRIVDGGFPCQDISNAGKRAGITGARSGLWREMVRCIRVVRPDLVFVENVAALLVRGMGEVLGDLANIGYDAIGDCISAADVGAPHLRKRIWLVAYPNGRGLPESRVCTEQPRRAKTKRPGKMGNTSSPRNWRLSIQQGRSLQTDPHFNRTGETLADTASGGQPVCGESSWQSGFAGHGGEAMANAKIDTTGRLPERTIAQQSIPGINSEDVADTNSGRCKQRDAHRRELPIADTGSAEISNAVEERLEGAVCAELAGTREGRSNTNAAGSGRWPVEPDVGRVANGIPKRVDRLAALGDAIVPACVEEVIRRFLNF